MNPFRTMLERGVEVGVGSDAPITPLDPMLCGRRRSRRTTTRRSVCGESRRSACTRSGGARVGHQEDKKGSLGPGMHADFAAYDVDPFDRNRRSRASDRCSRSRSGARSSRRDDPTRAARAQRRLVTLCPAYPVDPTA